MKTTKSLTLIAAALLLALASCKPVDDPQQVTKNVVVTTADPTFITSGTATLGAEVTADDAGLLLELGVCWSKTGTPTIDDQCAKTYRCSQPYQSFIANLEPNTQYHVRGFAKYGTEYCYGEEKTFNTLGPDAPSASPVTTLEATEITYESFCAAYSIVPFGITNYTAGLIYSTRPDLSLDNCEGIKTGYYDSETDSYPVCCYDLTPNTQYYYRAFVEYYTNDQPAYFYGEVLSLTTPEMPFVLNLYTNDPQYFWGNYYVIAHGEIECTMPEVVNQVGFCYSKDNEYPQFESDFHTTAATPTGDWHWYEFDSYIDNLSAHTKYYIRSYARYKTDSIKYGNVVSVDIN